VTSPDRAAQLRPRTVIAFWAPLAATWLMMAVEGPYVAAIIARLPDPTPNLAAYGVAFSFAFMGEAPIIMMMTAANTLVADRQSFLALRRFAFRLNLLLTAGMAIALVPPIFRLVTDQLIGLPPDLAARTHAAASLLVFWPAAIGYRRFYQGILVRHHLPRRVAYGTVVRLVTMSLSAAGLALFTRLPGAYVGALSLAGGVLAEAAASRWMAHHIVSALLAGPDIAARPPLTTGDIARFYVPLALTSMLTIVVNPLVTFFIGHSRSPIESLAVLPVVTGFAFIFRSGALAYQEVAVALTGGDPERERTIGRVAVWLAGASALTLGLVLFTPLAHVWFVTVSGLPPELGRFAMVPARVTALIPALDYLLSLQRALFVLARRTRVITAATAVEMAAILVAVPTGILCLDMVGATAATTALLVGRVGSNACLLAASRFRRPDV
jgi:progressive ankylosis protein